MRTSLGLALSGGGFRAAAFHLGVLRRLEDLDLLASIDQLSTVSGGSVVGALYALRCQNNGGAPGSYAVDEIIREIRPLLESNFRGRALFGTPLRLVHTVGSFATRSVSRVPLPSDAFDRELFKGAMFSQAPSWLLINATNLMTGKAWKFFHDRAGDYLIGATPRTESIRLADAVTASAAYPLLADPFSFHTRWENLREDLLDQRWEDQMRRVAGDVRTDERRAASVSLLQTVDFTTMKA